MPTDDRDTTTDDDTAATGDTADETTDQDVDETDTPDDTDETSTDGADADETDPDETDEGQTFDRAYVEKLRRESAGYRERARTADQLAQRLHTEMVRATGRLADPTDLAFDEDHLADASNMVAALDELLTRKPHLATRHPSGDIGQGATSSASSVDLAAILRQRAQ